MTATPQKKRLAVLLILEGVAVALCGAGAGLAFGLGAGLLVGGGLMWINITIGGLRR